MSHVEELELAIDNCKDLIRTCGQGSDKQKNLVTKLVQLRLKLQEINVSAGATTVNLLSYSTGFVGKDF